MMYQSLNRYTGGTLTDAEHISQSVQDILITPVGSRVMRRDYGSLLSELIDAPANDSLALQVTTAIYGALSRWEQRITLTSITLSRNDAGFFAQITASRTDTGADASLSVKLGGSDGNR